MALAGARAPASARKLTKGVGFDERRGVFLRTEADATARLGGLYAQMRREITDFMQGPDLTESDQTFYAELLRQADLRLKSVQTGAQTWVDQIIPAGFVAGATLQTTGMIAQPVHDQALRFLSGYTLDLIQDTGEDVRRTIQQEVAQGLAGSISRQQLVDRLVSSGLTSGPWKDVETRAMVIARTETMRAYNAGNVAGIRSNGAVLGKWVTSRDERVCYICGPRDGQTFVLPGVTEAEVKAAGATPGAWIQLDAVTARGTDSAPPAHPRCRCTLRAQYRNADGELLKPVEPAQDAKPADVGVEPDDLEAETDADFDAGLKDLGKPDPARTAALAEQARLEAQAETMRQELLKEERLYGHEYGHPLYGGPVSPEWQRRYNEVRAVQAQALQAGSWKPSAESLAYWRVVQLTPARIARIASIKGPAGNEAFRNALVRRYGMDVEFPKAGYPPEIRRLVLESLELYRSKVPGLVVDFAGLRGFGDRGFGKGMSGELGTWTSASRFFRISVGRLKAGGDHHGRGKIRGGTDVDAGLEVITHEIGHGIFHGVVKANPTLLAEWDKIRGGTARDRIAPMDTIATPESLALLEREIEAWGKDTRAVGIKYRQSLREQLDAAKRGPDGSEHFPTKYGRDGKDPQHEDFAESIMLYLLNPSKLSAYSPRRYAFLRDNVFQGREYQ